MTPVEIAAAVQGAVRLAIEILELIQAAQKGDVAAAEALKSITERTARNAAGTDKLHDYLDAKFDKGEP